MKLERCWCNLTHQLFNMFGQQLTVNYTIYLIALTLYYMTVNSANMLFIITSVGFGDTNNSELYYKITQQHNGIFHEALNKNIKGTYMNMNTDKAIMLCQ